MDNKKKLIFLGSLLVVLITLIAGTSYAVFTLNTPQEQTNVVTLDCFNITFKDRFDANDSNQSANINLLNAYPVMDSKGISLMEVPYTFEVKNECTMASSYYVNLEQLLSGKTDLSSSYLRMQFNNIVYNLTDFDTTTATLSNTVEARRLYSGYLNAGDSQTFTLRMWVNYDATMEQAGGKAYNAKVVVVSTGEPEDLTRYQITNLIPDGSFENNGWQLMEGDIFTYDNNTKHYGQYSAYIEDTANRSESLIVVRDNIHLTRYHKYYSSIWSKSNIAVSVEMYWPHLVTGQGAWYSATTSSTWSKHSVIFEKNNIDSGDYLFRMDFNNAGVNGYINYDDLILVDLTEAFGAGNEPDKEWCDNNINYFEGSTYVYK